MSRLLSLTFLLMILSSSCKKEKVPHYIKDNSAPPDSSLALLTTENYIQKVYISVLGRKAGEQEMNDASANLRANNLSKASRLSFLDQVFARPEYPLRTYNTESANLIQNTDSIDIRQMIDVFNFLLLDSSNQYLWPYFIIERDRLIVLEQTPDDFANGNINIRQVHRRLIDNYFYDQINMGTENFVVSSFQHFFFRYPTQAELESAKEMVDGFSAYLFLEPGSNKEEYMDIFFASASYYEGQVRSLFNRYLFRDPTTTESHEMTASYLSSGNYKELQKSILASDEFVFK